MPAQSVNGFQFTGGWTGDGCQQFGIGWLNQGGKDLFYAGWNRDNGCELFALGWLYNAPFVAPPPAEDLTGLGSQLGGDRRILRDDDEVVFATLVAFMEIRDRWH